jgi:hypothetical protein
MNKIITKGYTQPSLQFYNASTHQFQADIWDELKQGLWTQYNIDNRVYNDSIGEVRLSEWRPIFPNVIPIYSGVEWDAQHNRYTEQLYYPQYNTDENLYKFIDKAANFFDNYKDKKIGVHLSGGLDSSLIICLLHYLHIPCTLIGFSTKRFEFRTERYIQQKMMEYGEYAELIDLEQYPFYSKLSNTPRHQIPDSCIKQNEASRALAEAFAKQKVEVVFTGQGGDSLFVDAFIPNTTSFNIGNEFTFPWEQDLIYSPLGIELVSFFSDPTIIDAICSMRVGQKDDPLKWWARKTFKEILPIELSDYAYCADFFGISMSGLEAAKPEIRLLCEEAYDRIPHPIFNQKGIEEILSTDVFSLEHKTYCALCTKISIAVWLHSLFRDNENK